jgi:uncharacterized membrane protein YdjX (TVP38/TMEM64 family)
MSSISLRTIRQVLLTPRKIIGAGVLGAVIAFLLLGPREEEFLQHQAAWKAAVAQDPWLWSGLYFGVMALLISFSIPIASGMMLIGGFLFGRWQGMSICFPAAALGAIQAMVLTRFLFQPIVRRLAARQEWIHQWLLAVDRGIEREGWYYLLLLRLTPIIPFFVINLLMGVTRIRVSTYSWVTTLGLFPSTFIFVNAGAAVSHIRSVGDLVSLETLLSVMLLVLIPIFLRLLLPGIRAAETGDEAGMPISSLAVNRSR